MMGAGELSDVRRPYTRPRCNTTRQTANISRYIVLVHVGTSRRHTRSCTIDRSGEEIAQDFGAVWYANHVREHV
jgi:hypothetical protein